MRASVLLSVTPLALACATQTVTSSAVQPEPAGLTVQMLQPSRGALRFTLSEPAYVTVFSVTPGSGIELVSRLEDRAVARQRRAGYNEQGLPGGPPGSLLSSRRPSVQAQTLYLIASLSPLPVRELLETATPDVAAAGTVDEALTALAAALNKELPAEAWAAHGVIYPAAASRSASRRGPAYAGPCGDRSLYPATAASSTRRVPGAAMDALSCELRTSGTRFR